MPSDSGAYSATRPACRSHSMCCAGARCGPACEDFSGHPAAWKCPSCRLSRPDASWVHDRSSQAMVWPLRGLDPWTGTARSIGQRRHKNKTKQKARSMRDPLSHQHGTAAAVPSVCDRGLDTHGCFRVCMPRVPSCIIAFPGALGLISA